MGQALRRLFDSSFSTKEMRLSDAGSWNLVLGDYIHLAVRHMKRKLQGAGGVDEKKVAA